MVLSCTKCGVTFSSSYEIRRVRWHTVVNLNEVDMGKVFVPSRVFTAPAGVSFEQVVMDTVGLDDVGETIQKLASSGIRTREDALRLMTEDTLLDEWGLFFRRLILFGRV